MYADSLVPIRDLGYANAALLIGRTEMLNALQDKQIAGRQKYFELMHAENKKVDSYVAAYGKTRHIMDPPLGRAAGDSRSAGIGAVPVGSPR